MSSPYRIGLDIGGTFTDVVLVHDPSGTIRMHKVLTTPRNPATGALRAVREVCAVAGIRLAEVSTLVHATTLVTNALIERKGARTALLTTKGFRDVLEMGKEQRYDIYDLFLQYPEPLVPRRWRIEVTERITRDGEIRTALDLVEVRRKVSALVAQGIESIAVAFLHAYKNPIHEQQVKALIEADFPHLPVCISSEVSPEIREFERMSTTVVNAYVLPLVDRYIRRIDAALIEEGFGGRFLLMLSSGTLAMPEFARRFPVRLLESGPVAGSLVAGQLGREAGRQDIVAFDMGGTTAKVCLVRSGRPNVTPMTEVARVHRFKPGSGLPVKTPVVDMIEIGAGGGSVAHVGPMGLLLVGPLSAGADPGPACYGLGGTEATVTDACVVLGYIDPGAFLGGSMRLNAEAARNALTRAGAPLGLDPVQTAWGIFAIVCENMAQAARLYLIERGQDPRHFALMGFGGAGPATATRVAHLLGMAEILIPPASGVASAVGLLMAPLGFDFGHSYAGELDDLDWTEVERLYAEMETEGRRMVTAGGTQLEEVHVERRAEMRYARQFHDIEIQVPSPLLGSPAAVLRDRFDAEYARLYGVTLQGYPVQALNWRVLVASQAPQLDLLISPREGNPEPLKGRRPIYLPTKKRFVEVSIYDRYRLTAGAILQGPAVVEEADATALLWPGDHLTVDRRQNLVITISRARNEP